MVKNPPANAGDARDMGLIPGSGRSPGEGNSNPLQYSCLGNPWTEEPGGLRSTGLQSRTRLWATEHTCQEPLPILFVFTLALIWQGRCNFSHLLHEDTSHLVKYFESKLKSQAQSTKCACRQLIPLDHFYINSCQVNFFSVTRLKGKWGQKESVPLEGCGTKAQRECRLD